MRKNIPTLNGLNQAIKSAEELTKGLAINDVEEHKHAAESLRKAKENLRIFIYRQQPHLTGKGRRIRA